MTEKTKKASRVPHPIVILFCIVILMSVLTYVIPAGQYERAPNESGRTVVDPDSFAYTDQNPISFMGFLQAFPGGMAAAQEIIFFIFIVGGSFQIITATKAIEAGIGKVARKMQGKGKFMIFIIIAVFSAGGATFGMSEECIIFIPIGVAMARALGYDAITGAAIVILGAACGFNAGVMNPFTVGVAQGIAELPLFSGIAMRLVIIVVMVIVTSLYVIRYGEKVRKDPSKSLVYDLELSEKDEVIRIDNLTEMTGRHVAILLVVVAGFALIIYGVFTLGWYITEIGSIFLLMGIIGGFIGGLKINELAGEFLVGARDITSGALMVGFARAILVVMENGLIIDTVIFTLAGVIQTLPKAITVIGMYIVQIVINFFIPSGSGQAAATMPIMIPLSDVLGINRQVAVLAFQFGDGFTNSIIPTSASLIAALAAGKINYEKWVKFVAPIVGIWIIVGMCFLLVGNAIGYGPF